MPERQSMGLLRVPLCSMQKVLVRGAACGTAANAADVQQSFHELLSVLRCGARFGHVEGVRPLSCADLHAIVLRLTAHSCQSNQCKCSTITSKRSSQVSQCFLPAHEHRDLDQLDQVMIYQLSAGVDNGISKLSAPLEALLMYSALRACFRSLLLQ